MVSSSENDTPDLSEAVATDKLRDEASPGRDIALLRLPQELARRPGSSRVKRGAPRRPGLCVEALLWSRGCATTYPTRPALKKAAPAHKNRCRPKKREYS